MSEYLSPHAPWSHQMAALDRLERQEECFALLMDMRTGKTKTLLDDFGRLELAGLVSNLLVVAPGGVYRTWEAAAKEHLSVDLKTRLIAHTWRSGSSASEKNKLKNFMGLEKKYVRILLMNIEALSSVKAARETAIAFLKSGPSMMVVDESTIIKNPSAKRTKFVVMHLGSIAKFRRILSGLPSPKSPLDLYSQFEFLDWKILGFKSYYAFRNRYAIIENVFFGGRRSVPLVKGFKNEDELQAKIAPYSFRVRLADCYDLPPKIYVKREVTLTEEQQRLYKEMKEFATAQLDAEAFVTATVVIAQMIRLHQILCGHTRDEMGNFHEIPEYRTKALIDLLNEQSGKAIVWCSYDADVRKVASALNAEFGEGSTAKFWGGNRATREDEERRFLTDPACRNIVATAAAGGRGRTWTVADLVVYYSNTHDLEHRSQSEERAQAVDKRESVAYVDLIVPGTVDEKIIESLRQKIDLSSAVMGDAYREWLI